LLSEAAEAAGYRVDQLLKGFAGKKPAGKKPARKAAAQPKRATTARAETKKPVAKNKKATLLDDLTLIEGIGPKMAGALKAAGIETFAALAKATEADLKKALEAAKLRFAPSLPTWAKQAALLAKGDRAGFEAYTRALKGGREV
jgi:predicted flap endonuclease-1-like 5' DNA nuclease